MASAATAFSIRNQRCLVSRSDLSSISRDDKDMHHSPHFFTWHRQVFCVNDLKNQRALRDRRYVYAALRRNRIPLLDHVIVNRAVLRRLGATS